MPKPAVILRSYVLATILFLPLSRAGAASQSSAGPDALFDPNRYIGIDEIKPGMNAYCLTVFDGTKVERFELEVLSVVRNVDPGRDAIMVKGTDERFIHTGPVAGCSGSPVYIEGRLAGALAFGWSFSKDPLYGVTPIDEMLEAGTADVTDRKRMTGLNIDVSGPLDLKQIEQQALSELVKQGGGTSSIRPLPLPVIVSPMPDEAGRWFEQSLSSFGLMPVAGGSAAADSEKETVQLEPGSCLTIPLCTGDIDIAVIGTATEVKDGEVFGFGHSFLGYGPVELPMATGQVHTVVANTMRSFKFGSPLDIVGTLTADEASAVRGVTGRVPKMIPMNIKVKRYNDPEARSYDCKIADNRTLTPVIVRYSVSAAVLQRGSLPPDHTLRYKTRIALADGQTLNYDNISSDSGTTELVSDTFAPLTLLLNNPFEPVEIESVHCEIEELDTTQMGTIRSVELSDNRLEQGESFTVTAVIKQVRGPEKKYNFSMTVPADLEPGEYRILVTGGDGYIKFLRQAAPQRFMVENIETMMEALNNILSVRRDRLYCILLLPAGGIALERAELPDLPLTRALVLADATRSLNAQPYRHWLEKNTHTPVVIDGEQEIKIEVIKPYH